MKTHARNAHRSGFTLIEIMIVVLIIGTLAAMAVPNIIESLEKSRRTVCISNLKRIDGAKVQWAAENHVAIDVVPTASNLYGKGCPIREEPHCPSGGTYTLNAVEEKPICSVAGHAY
jgi:prepilin-type N-terminal cleavage/methylation domain-containing protein